MLQELDNWRNSKSKILTIENLKVVLSAQLGEPIKAQYIEIKGNGLIARATLWENGNLVLKAICCQSDKQVILKHLNSCDVWQIDDELNWWLSQIVIYDPS
ncbi:hypothetical protein [Pseudoalteromonas lipolytica]|uniref:Uncharacterized protein n=1 Tax=Pseudoalteromonas lipolytica TaxID=570156 RepID=A0A0N8HKU2_9GAMM|nr:hypothetical protein [Pseudoalteromonas lipolytica]KPM84832.1 hypothetical protein AOG27_03325 [Pseudoalteromonas lipolytica]|tara:strand:- start:332 stop:634 length:303 start_codon:yes stop_codon:yes gene_type:complete